MMFSIIIRTFNEEKFLGQLLEGIKRQEVDDYHVEILIVDSGSTDKTMEIARDYDCKILHIKKDEFSFGRSLNIGCAAANERILVFISGHCVPYDKHWLINLGRPLIDGCAVMAYGRQVGGPTTKLSEHEIFAKFFPEKSAIPQKGFFCNNANSAILKTEWEIFRFDEQLTGLEDMAIGRLIVNSGKHIAYVAEACVYHHHDESWKKVKSRYEREAIALQYIMPEMQLSVFDVIRYTISAIIMDFRSAIHRKCFLTTWREIILFRFMQYLGSYVGNHEHRQLSRAKKHQYFYPG